MSFGFKVLIMSNLLQVYGKKLSHRIEDNHEKYCQEVPSPELTRAGDLPSKKQQRSLGGKFVYVRKIYVFIKCR
jgi:hypothetical protein